MKDDSRVISRIEFGAKLPDDMEERAWIVDALEGKLDPKRGRGRPRKKTRRNDVWDYVRGSMEAWPRFLLALGGTCFLLLLSLQEQPPVQSATQF